MAEVDPKDRLWIGISLGVLFVAILVAFILLRNLRHRLHSSHHDSQLGSAFTLEQLRQLHRQGTISDEEYENLRDTMFSDIGASDG